MGYCPKCDVIIGSRGKYHGDCGTELISDKLTCPYCDNKTWITDMFCIFCGRPIQDVIRSIRKGGV